LSVGAEARRPAGRILVDDDVAGVLVQTVVEDLPEQLESVCVQRAFGLGHVDVEHGEDLPCVVRRQPGQHIQVVEGDRLETIG
jgi:hypothetical protein